MQKRIAGKKQGEPTTGAGRLKLGLVRTGVRAGGIPRNWGG